MEILSHFSGLILLDNYKRQKSLKLIIYLQNYLN